MLNHARALWRDARARPLLRAVTGTLDRLWWARVILRADVVDMDFVRAQGGPRTVRGAVRAYTRGGFRTGFTLNPLLAERLVSSQLSDAGRVPALYAYLVNDARKIAANGSWDAPAHARAFRESITAPGGPLGHAWRLARERGWMVLGGELHPREIPWPMISATAARAAGMSRSATPAKADGAYLDSAVVMLARLGLDEHDPAGALLTIAEASLAMSAATVVTVANSSADLWAQAALLELWLPRTKVVRDSPDMILRVRERAPSHAVLVVRGRDGEISTDDLVELAREGIEGAVAPLWLDLDGTVASAGAVVRDGRRFSLLAGHPPEDARVLGNEIETVAVDSATFAAPVTASSVSPLARTRLDLIVRAPSHGHKPAADADPDSGVVDIDQILAPSRLRVAQWTQTGPVLRRSSGSVMLADGSKVPTLRWAIKIVAPPGVAGESWGDTHFARGIADALRRLGQEVVIDSYDARERATAYLDDVVLALRGPQPFRAQAGAVSLIWVISHPDEIEPGELASFDRVFAGSASWAQTASVQFGLPVVPLLQCTDARRFLPSGAAREDGLVFVGTARGVARPSIIEPLRAGIPVSVYGPDWRGWIPASAIKGTTVPNDRLPVLYETADAVLNDHWPAMRVNGFVSNRLYDVVASGGRAVSDSVDGMSEIFGGAVVTYDSIPQLLEILASDLDVVFPSSAELADISETIRRAHSFDARARTLLEAALEASQSAS